jgi:hypothetical protein
MCSGEEKKTFLEFQASDLDSKDNTDEKELVVGRMHPFPEGFVVRLEFEVKD